MSLGLIVAGIRLMSVGPSDPNKWRGFVFAPLAIVLGLVLLVVFVAVWRRRDDQRARAKGGEGRRRLKVK
jgi:hypothetical protein